MIKLIGVTLIRTLQYFAAVVYRFQIEATMWKLMVICFFMVRQLQFLLPYKHKAST